MRLFAIFSGKRNEIPLRRYLRVAQPKGGNSPWRYALTLFALLLSQASLPTVHGQNAAPVTLSGPQLRVEVRSVNGRLEEKYQGKAGTKWITIASGAGETEGPVSVHGADGEVLVGTLRGVSIEQGALVERLSAGPHEITRTIKLTDRRDWVHVETRLEPHGRVELHSLADSFRFEGQPDWSYSPSIGGFNPDAQYKGPLILTQERPRSFGIVPDLAVLTRELIQRCPHSLDLDASAGPRLTVGFIPSRTYFHSVFVHDLDRSWSADQPFVNSYYLLVTATAPSWRGLPSGSSTSLGEIRTPRIGLRRAGTGRDRYCLQIPRPLGQLAGSGLGEGVAGAVAGGPFERWLHGRRRTNHAMGPPQPFRLHVIVVQQRTHRGRHGPLRQASRIAGAPRARDRYDPAGIGGSWT